MSEFWFGVMVGVAAMPLAIVVWLGVSMLAQFLRGDGGWK